MTNWTRAKRRYCAWAAMVAAPLLMACGSGVPETARTAETMPGAATGEVHGAGEARAAIASEWRACREADDYASPSARQECDSRAIAASSALLPRSRGNTDFDPLLVDLFEPLLFARTGGEDALAERVVVTGAYAEFAQRRAAILTGASDTDPSRLSSRAAVDGSLIRLGDGNMARSFARRWEAVRNADCVAYPVSDCAARLDAAFHEMMDGLDPGA